MRMLAIGVALVSMAWMTHRWVDRMMAPDEVDPCSQTTSGYALRHAANARGQAYGCP